MTWRRWIARHLPDLPAGDDGSPGESGTEAEALRLLVQRYHADPQHLVESDRLQRAVIRWSARTLGRCAPGTAPSLWPRCDTGTPEGRVTLAGGLRAVAFLAALYSDSAEAGRGGSGGLNLSVASYLNGFRAGYEMARFDAERDMTEEERNTSRCQSLDGASESLSLVLGPTLDLGKACVNGNGHLNARGIYSPDTGF